MFTYDTLQKVNNKRADQTAQMYVLFANPRREYFSRRGPVQGTRMTKNWITNDENYHAGWVVTWFLLRYTVRKNGGLLSTPMF